MEMRDDLLRCHAAGDVTLYLRYAFYCRHRLQIHRHYLWGTLGPADKAVWAVWQVLSGPGFKQPCMRDIPRVCFQVNLCTSVELDSDLPACSAGR